MITFALAAAGLIVVTLLLLLRPWVRSTRGDAASASEVNAGIYRDQLLELDRDLAAGTIAAAEHAQARAELQRRLLDDVGGAAEATPRAAAARKRTTLSLALALPLGAIALYAWLGTPAALNPPADATPTLGEVVQMVENLAAKLEKNPDDSQGWTVLARSYRVMGRLPDARRAYERIGAELEGNPLLLAEYADVLAALDNGRIEGRPLELVQRALKIDPDNAMALSLAATAAFRRNDMAQAIVHWERLLKQLPPESDDAKWLVKTLAEVRGAGAGAAAQPPAARPAAAGESIRGRVSLAPALAAQALPTDTVFVFARAPQGSRMPLAVQRARVADLPLDFQLDDSSAMSPALKLSGAAEVRIEARISRSGSATPAAGDLIGVGPVVKPGANAVAVQIDQVRP